MRRPTPLKDFFETTGIDRQVFADACSEDRGHVVPLSRLSEWSWHEPNPINKAMLERVTRRFGHEVGREAWRTWVASLAKGASRRAGGA